MFFNFFYLTAGGTSVCACMAFIAVEHSKSIPGLFTYPMRDLYIMITGSTFSLLLYVRKNVITLDDSMDGTFSLDDVWIATKCRVFLTCRTVCYRTQCCTLQYTVLYVTEKVTIHNTQYCIQHLHVHYTVQCYTVLHVTVHITVLDLSYLSPVGFNNNMAAVSHQKTTLH